MKKKTEDNNENKEKNENNNSSEKSKTKEIANTGTREVTKIENREIAKTENNDGKSGEEGKTNLPAKLDNKRNDKRKKEKPLKLPKIFKKKYTVRKFKRKILKRIYIPEDKVYVQGFFIQEESSNQKKPGKFFIPTDKKIQKKDLRRLKTIAKQIKKQKGRVRLVPLIACVSFIAIIVTLFITTKNVFLKKVTRNLLENQFEARCDIAYLNLGILDSSFTVKGFEIADKNDPMKNLFSFDSLVIDFDLVQLLKKKFVAEEFSLEEIAVGSDRTYDGTLPAAKLKKIRDKKAKKTKEKEEKKQKIQQSFNNATNQVKDNVNNSIAEIFETFNPKNILENCYVQLITPEVVGRIQDETLTLIDKWKATPERVGVQVNNVKQSTEDIINFDYSAIRDDPEKIRDMLATFDSAYQTLNGVKEETESILADIESDVQKVTALTIDVKESVEHDVDVTKNEINKLTSFRLPSGQEFLSSTIDIYGHELLGKYYPKVKQAINYLLVLKDKQVDIKLPEKKVKKEKKEKEVKRAAGRDITFTKDRNPKVWIKKVAASGFNMSLNITNISNDMNRTDLPTEALFNYKYNDIIHGGKVVVDIRTETPNPLVYLEYTCDGTSFSHSDNLPGVPQIDTNANYICNAKVMQDQSFVLSGRGDFYNLNLTSLPFEPPYIFEIYKNILGRFDSAEVGLEIKIDPNRGLFLNADTDLDEKIANALKDEINSQLTKIKEAIEQELSARIKEYTDKAKVVVDKFKEIENKVRNLENQLQDLEKRLEEKKEDFENRLTAIQEQAEEKIRQETERVQNEIEDKLQQEAEKREEKLEQAKDKLQQKAEEGKQAAEKAATDALKGFLGGFRR